MNNEFQGGGFPSQPNQTPQQPMMPQQPIPTQTDFSQQPMVQQPMTSQQPIPTQTDFSQQPMMAQQPMVQQSMSQQPMMTQQPLQQPVPQQPGGFGGYPTIPNQPTNGNNNGNKLPLIIVGAVVGLVLFILLINVVTTKTLECTDKDSSAGMTMESIETASFKFGKIKNWKEKVTIDYSDASDEVDDYIKELEDSLEEQMKEKCKSGCKYSIKNKNDKIVVTMEIKVSSKNFEKVSGIADDISFKDLKSKFKDTGATCK